ncbi:hypothetical protein BT63DRAFT_12192 [Microthyrium microscopicum]|uniref:Uncharacterized protein n=1 Tax=Microthyrium microscopicum TaxID=703497 RepID=A0A6A6USW0_9PEZI|nr:hypothetical protein BT63DRAFT_12192 [Microthyrium microscopicum]
MKILLPLPLLPILARAAAVNAPSPPQAPSQGALPQGAAPSVPAIKPDVPGGGTYTGTFTRTFTAPSFSAPAYSAPTFSAPSLPSDHPPLPSIPPAQTPKSLPWSTYKPSAPAAPPAAPSPASPSAPAALPAPPAAHTSAAPAPSLTHATPIAPAISTDSGYIGPSSPTSIAAAPAPNPVNSARLPSATDTIPLAQCIAGGSKSGAWAPFVVAHTGSDGQCPVDAAANIFWAIDAEGIGCCPQNNYLSTAVAGQFACCPCGSSCAGLPPQALQDWSLASGNLLIGGNTITAALGSPGSSATAAALGAIPPGVRTQTTATRVLYSTFRGTTCVAGAGGVVSCGLTTAVVPTATAFGVVTRNGAVAKARATGGAVVVGVVGVVGAMGGLGSWGW